MLTASECVHPTKKSEYVLLNGNQTGAILVQYLAKYRKLTKKGLFNTIVTSSLGAKIAEKYDIDVVSTLTLALIY